jgi:hypothetical protein
VIAVIVSFRSASVFPVSLLLPSFLYYSSHKHITAIIHCHMANYVVLTPTNEIYEAHRIYFQHSSKATRTSILSPLKTSRACKDTTHSDTIENHLSPSCVHFWFCCLFVCYFLFSSSSSSSTQHFFFKKARAQTLNG